MTFKANWEKTDQHTQLLPQTIEAMVAQGFPNQNLLSYHVISGGCANLNMKISIENESHFYILRIYLRDKEAAYREQKIASLFKGEVPVPEVLFVGDQVEDDIIYRFSINQFFDGVPLRELLLNSPEDVWQDLMEDVGIMLSLFHRITFPKAGFLDANLDVPTPFQPDDLTKFVAGCLDNPQVQRTLGDRTIRQLDELFKAHCQHLPTESFQTLVHGDFDPANILVHQLNGKWQISAILDWEFSFSGSWLWDVANMLRYSHQMPKKYEDSFIRGLNRGGLSLPEDWRIIISLFNISSLLDSLSRHPIDERPILRQDICKLIEQMIDNIKGLIS